jgi:hypothetical protein
MLENEGNEDNVRRGGGKMKIMLGGVGVNCVYRGGQLWGQYGFWGSGIQVSYMHEYKWQH